MKTGLGVAVCLGGLLLASGASAQAESEFSERIAVIAVEIPVRVLIKGRPVAGLARDDFEVLEDGVPRAITGFEVVDLRTAMGSGIATEPRPDKLPAVNAMRGEGRRILLLFDSAFSSKRNLKRAVEGARDLVADIHPQDRVAVASYSLDRGISFVCGFSAERARTVLALDAVAAAVDNDREGQKRALAELAKLAQSSPLARHGTLRRLQALSQEFGVAAALAAGGGRVDLGTVAQSVALGGAEESGAGDRFRVADAGMSSFPSPVAGIIDSDPALIAADLARSGDRSSVRALALSLAEFATLMREIPGQKQLLFFSEGFAAGHLEDAMPLSHLQKALEALRRGNWTLNAIDIRGQGFGAHSLFFLASETGGELVENFRDMTVASKRVLNRTSYSYVLTIQPTDIAVDGRYRKLKVRLRDGTNAKVLHRPGYYAPKPRDQKTKLERELDNTSLLLGETERSEIDAALLALPLADGAGAVDVPVVVELGAASLRRGSRRAARLEVHCYALDSSGMVQDLFFRELKIRREDLALIPPYGGIRIYDRVTLAPGEHKLRLLIRDVSSGAYHLSTFKLDVPGGGVGPALYAPLFVVREGWKLYPGGGNLLSGPRGEHPFILAGRRMMPTPRPRLRNGKATTVVLKAGPRVASDLRISARVLDEDGNAMSIGRFEFTERIVGAAEKLDALVARFAPSGLTPGRYLLEITASSQENMRQSTAATAFEIVPDGV